MCSSVTMLYEDTRCVPYLLIFSNHLFCFLFYNVCYRIENETDLSQKYMEIANSHYS